MPEKNAGKLRVWQEGPENGAGRCWPAAIAMVMVMMQRQRYGGKAT